MTTFRNLTRRAGSQNTTESNPILPDAHGDIASSKRSYKLLDVEKLDIDPKNHDMFRKVNQAVMDYMYGPTFDAFHDYERIQRVVAQARKIYEAQKDEKWVKDIHKTVMYIACMVHDVGYAKYNIDVATDGDQEDIIREFLKANGCDKVLRCHAVYIGSRVSYSRELREPNEIKEGVRIFGALRIVQDADRLDGLGAIGIGRCFVFGGINEERRTNTIQTGVKLHLDCFQKYLELMETEKGKELAKERLDFMEKYRQHWSAETECSSVL